MIQMCCRFLTQNVVTAVFATLLIAVPAAAQPPGVVEDDNPSRRLILDLVRQIRELQSSQPVRAAELFDTAWEVAVLREDPLINVNTSTGDELQPGEHRVNAGARAVLAEIFRTGTDEFRRACQEQVKAAAETGLKRAEETGPRELQQTILRYQFTPAGQRALERVVRIHESRGEYLQAALQLGRLLRLQQDHSVDSRVRLALLWWNAGLPEEAESWLLEVVREQPSAHVTVDTADLQLPASPKDVRPWLQNLAQRDDLRIAVAQPPTNWTQPLANYRRRPRQDIGPAVLHERWNAGVFECVWNPDLSVLLKPLAEAVRELATERLNSGFAVAPAAQPVLVDDLIIFRGAANLRAVRRDTGELVWESSHIDPQLSGALDVLAHDPDSGQSNLEAILTVLRNAVFEHLVRANTAGQLTCAGDLVFSVDEVTTETIPAHWDQQTPNSSIPVNYLRAHNRKTGQFVGMLGGQIGLSAKDVAANPLKGFFVLGAPLVIGDRIYLMAENDQGIFLLQIAFRQLDQRQPPFSLRPVHSQLLTHPRLKLRQHPVRMFAGLTPSFGRGLLICNTCDEQIIAVSAEDHSVRWVHRYSTSVSTPELNAELGGVLGNAFGRQASNEVDLAQRWQDALPRILTDRILVTPRDSAQLLCLDLETGRKLWTRPRGSLRRIVAADDDRVILTGTDTVACLNCVDGSTLWESRISEGVICGMAATSDTVVHIPTSAPAIVSLDTRTGRRLLSRPVDGDLPGNLFSIAGRLYSQSLTDVRCFSGFESVPPPRMEIACRRLLEGDSAGAEEILREIVHSSDPHDQPYRNQATSMLIDSIMESLRTDFHANAHRIPELKDLIRQSSPGSDRLAALTQSLLGLTPLDIARLPELLRHVDQPYRLREQLQMMIATHQLEGFDGTPTELAEQIVTMLRDSYPIRESFGRVGQRELRISHAVAASIAKALKQSAPEVRSRVLQSVSPLLAKQIADASTFEERRWWCNMSIISGLAESTVDAFKNTPTSTTEERLLRQLCAAAVLDDPHAKNPFQQTALRLWIDDHGPQTTSTLRYRSRLFNNEQRQRLQDIPPSLSVPSVLAAPAQLTDLIPNADNDSTHADDIPYQQDPVVRVTPMTAQDEAQLSNAIQRIIPVFGRPGEFPRWSLVQRHGSDAIEAIDDAGRIRWRFEPRHSALGTSGQFGWRYNRVSNHYAVVWDHFVAIKMQQLIFVLDCRTADRRTAPQLLWQSSLLEHFSGLSRAQQVVQAWQRTTQYDMQPSGLFPLAEISPKGIVLYSGRRMILFDLLTGSKNWQIDSLPDDATLSVTDDHVLLISESSGSVQVHSLVDGSVVRETPLPPWWVDASENSNASVRDFEPEPGETIRWRLNVADGQCTLFQRTTESCALECYDLATGTQRWSTELPADSVPSNIVDGHIAVLSDGRRLQILNLWSGRIMADTDIPPAPKCRFLYLRPAHKNWIVLTDVFDTQTEDQNPVGSATVHVHGPVCAIDEASGKLIWSMDCTHRWLRILNPEQGAFPPVAPVLVLLSQPYRRDETGRIRGATLQAQIIDTRTGRLLFEDDDLGYGISFHRLQPNPDSGRVTVSFDKLKVDLDFAANHREPE